MPELPEVETIKNELMPHVIGKKIVNISIAWDRMVKQPSVKEFLAGVIGQRIISLKRRGKYLLFGLSSGETLVMHMKMTGSLLVNDGEDKFVRAVIDLEDARISFRDPRKFGAMWLTENGDAIDKSLGPEPLEESFTHKVFAERMQKRAGPIKAVLLDQSFIAGVGNMYADEALFAARIHPLRPANSLSPAETKRLHQTIIDVLRAGIGKRGASIQNYFRPNGEPGTAHFEFKVAHGMGKNCPVCGSPVQRIVVRNRGTYLCPKCQPYK
jgi:formamidopyrimidine-DNA glycosylase